MTVNRIFDLLDRYQERYINKDVAFGGKQDGIWQLYSSADYIRNSRNVAYGLIHLGILPGDKIISITNNRPEWNFLDMGIQMAGAIHVPVYPNISDNDYEYILNHSEARMVFVAGEEMYRRIKHLVPEIPAIQWIYTFRNLHGLEHLSELMNFGANNPHPERLKQIMDNIKGDDIATMIYTSGTTGNPKAVMLSHNNLISNFVSVHTIPPQNPALSTISFLPLCHVYERMLNYMYQYNGYTVYYVENVATLVDMLKEVKPSIMSTVPRLLESIFDKIMSSGRKLKGLKRIIFFWALRLGMKFDYCQRHPWYNFNLGIARMLVFSKWKKALGGNLDIIVSGGAALQVRLAKIFWAAGFRVIEGYGLTETSPVIAVSTFEPNGIVFGTVGPPLRGVSVRIAEDGEIQCAGPNVMKGYFKEDQLSKDSMTVDGWFKTGDIGEITATGQLRITDRKKEIFKTAAGKYIAPQVIENMFKESPFIENIMVIGENQKHAAAIISPSFSHLKSWCEVKGIEFQSNKDALAKPEVRKRFAREVESFNKSLGEHERIIKFEITDASWSVETGELTPTLKLKRSVIASKFQDLIGHIYNANLNNSGY